MNQIRGQGAGKSFREITAQLKEAARKAGLRESDVPCIVARFSSKR